MQKEKRTKGNAKWLFQTDPKDGWLRRIPAQGSFGQRNIPSLGLIGNFHIGTDYGADIGEKLTAYDDGIVLSTRGHSDYGHQVFIYFHKIDKTGHYAHMNSISVQTGQKVKAQEVIGTSGNSGKSGGPHLHFGFAEGKVYSTFKSLPWINFENYKYNAKTSDKPKAGGYINIHPGRKYGTYKLGVAPMVANIDQWLEPDVFGGISYKIEELTKYPDVFIISTRDFGKRQIFLDPSRANTTDAPLYGVKTPNESKPAPKPQPKPKPSAPATKVEYINLLPSSAYPKYGYYSLNDTPVRKNIRGYLTPNYYGGLSYKIKKRNSDGTVVVTTGVAGDVKLYVDSSRATITSSPKYGASSGGSSQKYVNFKPNNTNYILRHANNVSKFYPGGLNPKKHGGVSIPVVKDLGNNYYTIKSSAFDPNVVAVLVDSRWSYVSSKADYKIL